MSDQAMTEQKQQKNYYSVAIGSKLGIYTKWGQCHKQVNTISGALYEGFNKIEEAEKFVLDNTPLTSGDIVVYDGKARGLERRRGNTVSGFAR